MSSARGIIGWFGLFGILGQSVACESPPEASVDAPSKAPVASSPRASPAASQARTILWEKGAANRYRLTLKSRLDLGVDGSALELDLESDLDVFVRVAGAETVDFGIALRTPRLRGSGQKSATDLERLSQEIEKPFLFELEGGRLGAARLARGASSFAAAIQRTIASAFQYSRSPGANVTWTVEETDATGKYLVEYEAMQDATRFRKKKLRYGDIPELQMDSAPLLGLDGIAAYATPKVSESSGELTVLPSRLETVRYRERLETNLVAAAAISSTTELTLERKNEPASNPPDFASLDASHLRLAPGVPYANPTESKSLDPVRIQNQTFSEVVSELERMERNRPPGTVAATGGPPPKREAHLFLTLTAMFRQDPSSVKQALLRIRRASPARAVLLSALASSGAPAAEDAIVEIANDTRLDPEIRRAATSGLARAPELGERAERALVALLDDPLLHVRAMYGLGAAARRLRDAGEVARADRVAKLLVERLRAATNPADSVAALHGLANAADSGALESVGSYLEHDEPTVRMAAAQAVGSIKTAEADALLASRIEKESMTSVRTAILSACANRKPSERLTAAIATVAEKAPDPHGRIEAVRVLGRWLPSNRELRETLERIARSDPQPKVKEAAEAALAR